jgi:NADPH:quinone reductase-like Zn-dependent oxidoreductase
MIRLTAYEDKEELMTERVTSDQLVVRKTMKAMVQDRYGPAAEVLTMREVQVPEPGPGEVLVRVHSSSVNAMEWHLMNGKPYVFRVMMGFTPRDPTLGADVSGTVVATGPGVTRFSPGDRVFGAIGIGAYAEFARAGEGHLTIVPSGVGLAEAGAVGIAGLTALQGLRDVMGVGEGQRLLVNGASGGVGTFAIQIGKALGAEVTAVCSTRNVEQARRLGADEVLDYEKTDVTKSAARFDAFFDIAGNHRLRECARLLEPGAIYVMVGGPKGNWTGPLLRMIRGRLVFAFGGKRTDNFVAESREPDLAQLGAWLASGQLSTVIEETVPLGEVGAALDRQGAFHARAKTAVLVEGAV